MDSNKAALEILGFTINEAVGQSLFDPRVNPVHVNGSPMDVNDYPITMTLSTGEPSANVTVGLTTEQGPQR